MKSKFSRDFESHPFLLCFVILFHLLSIQFSYREHKTWKIDFSLDTTNILSPKNTIWHKKETFRSHRFYELQSMLSPRFWRTNIIKLASLSSLRTFRETYESKTPPNSVVNNSMHSGSGCTTFEKAGNAYYDALSSK